MKNNENEINEKNKAYHKVYAKLHPEMCKKSQKIYREKNKDKIKAYRKKTQKSTIEYNKKWIANRRKRNINFYIIEKLRSHLYRGMKYFFLNKKQKSIEYLGCNIEELLTYWEFKYKIKLTLDMLGRGTGKWTIDHIKPICSFNLTKEEEIKECFHYTNLQPMLFEENCIKNKNYE